MRPLLPLLLLCEAAAAPGVPVSVPVPVPPNHDDKDDDAALRGAVPAHHTDDEGRTAPPTNTNIVFLLSDDLGFGDVSIASRRTEPPYSIPTPNIQRIADRGMVFRRAYSGQVCAPSRCMLMLGKHSGHCTIRGNDGSYSPLLPTDITVAAALNTTHTTALFGKWGLGNYASSGYPLSQGFGTFVGQDAQGACHNWYPLTIQNGTDDKAVLNTKNDTRNGTVCLGPKPESTCTWMNDHDASAAVSFIHAHAGDTRPFFLYLATTTPHIGHLGSSVPGTSGGKYPVPLVYRSQVPENWTTMEEKDYTDAQFGAAVIAQDDIVGRTLDAIDAAGVDKRTVVFFSGDNGPDDHSFTEFQDTSQFRGKKRSLHEGGIRQTVAVQWIGTIKPGSESQHLFSFVDFLVTALDIAGVPETSWPRPTDGVSALPALKGITDDKPSKRYLYWEYCGYGNYSGLLPQLYPEGWAQAVRLDDVSGTEWKGIRVDKQQLLLWNLTADPSESTPLDAAAHSDVRGEIVAIMDREHVESPQWPSNANPTQVCCGSCFSKHGCTGKGRNCPAPKDAAASAATDTASPRPALAIQDLHEVIFEASNTTGGTAVMAAAVSARELQLRHLSGVTPSWPGCGEFEQASAVFSKDIIEGVSIRFDVVSSSGMQCATPAVATFELRITSSELLDAEYLYTRHEVALIVGTSTGEVQWRAPFRGGERWLTESYTVKTDDAAAEVQGDVQWSDGLVSLHFASSQGGCLTEAVVRDQGGVLASPLTVRVAQSSSAAPAPQQTASWASCRTPALQTEVLFNDSRTFRLRTVEVGPAGARLETLFSYDSDNATLGVVLVLQNFSAATTQPKQPYENGIYVSLNVTRRSSSPALPFVQDGERSYRTASVILNTV